MKQKFSLPVFLFSFFLVLVLVLNAWFAFRAHEIAKERALIRNDYSTVNSIHNGLLSVTVWRNHLQHLTSNIITDFSFSMDQEAQLKAQISGVLDAMISEAQNMVDNPENFKGKVQKLAVNIFVDWDELREKIPVFTQTIMDEINNPENREEMKSLLLEKLNEYAVETHDAVSDSMTINTILDQYSSATIDDFNHKTATIAAGLTEKTFRYSFAILGSMLMFLLLWFFAYRQPQLRQPLFILSVALAFIALFLGLTSPMIEIDARINTVNFSLLGQEILFSDQIIFYQSKSILDIVHILLLTHKADSVFVGILLLTFSVLFPVAKLSSTIIYLLGRGKIKANRLIQFFAFKSGKWSMADVFCVAIFMAYVGFNGILDDQMKDLNLEQEAMTSIATNLTSLQPGFIMFVSFVIFGLILAEILRRITAKEEAQELKT